MFKTNNTNSHVRHSDLAMSQNIALAFINLQLRIDGRIWAKEVKVKSTNPYTADFVFEKDYKLPTLAEVEKFVTENKHLKDVTSAKEIEAEGTDLQKMTGILLEKIEELTLYTIEQQNQIELLKKEIKTIKK